MKPLLACLALCLGVAPAVAHAVSCADEWSVYGAAPVLVAPSDDAPLDTRVWVRLSPYAVDAMDAFRLDGPNGDGPMEVAARAEEHLVVLAPEALLDPGVVYDVYGGPEPDATTLWIGSFRTGAEVLGVQTLFEPTLEAVRSHSDPIAEGRCGGLYGDWIEVSVQAPIEPFELTLVSLSQDGEEPEGIESTFAFSLGTQVRWDFGDTEWSPNPNLDYPLWLASVDLAGNRTAWRQAGDLHMAAAACTCASSVAGSPTAGALGLLGAFGLLSRRRSRNHAGAPMAVSMRAPNRGHSDSASHSGSEADHERGSQADCAERSTRSSASGGRACRSALRLRRSAPSRPRAAHRRRRSAHRRRRSAHRRRRSAPGDPSPSASASMA